MRRFLEAFLLLLGAAAALLLALPHLRPGPGAGHSSGTTAPTFHAGKSVVPPPSNGCGGKGCHGGAPHRGGSMAAFRNLHAGKVECAACHGASGRNGWGAGRGGYALAGTLPDPPEGNPHGGTTRRGPSCRDCHSREGEEALRKAGVATITGTFADPMALRMTEGGAKTW